MSGWLLLAAVLAAGAIAWFIYLGWRTSQARQRAGDKGAAGNYLRRRAADAADDMEFAAEPHIEADKAAGADRPGPGGPGREVAVPGWEHPIPWSYGETRLLALTRDPYWIFAYWELTDEVHRTAEEQVGKEAWFHARPIIRVHDATAGSHYDVAIDEQARNWYLNVGQPDRRWYLEIGRLTEAGRFVMLARSNTIHTPRDVPSGVVDWRWPPFAELYGEGFWPQGLPGSPGGMPASPGMPGSPGAPGSLDGGWPEQ